MSSSSASRAGMDVSSSSPSKIAFGPFDVSTQVFYETPLSFALVNLKPLLPGHVLVCPKKPHRRLTDLDAAELVDLFAAVQVVQRMLAAHYFGEQDGKDDKEQLQKGSFNIAVQDGPEAGQTVPHVHVHVLPRIRGTTAKDLSTEGDALYEKMTDEPGNVGGAQWDVASDSEKLDSSRPRPGGRFPRIEDASREARTMAAMEAEAASFRQALATLGVNHGVARHKE
ncbi:bis(5 -adenosyl)-triphosphatase [Ophiostoma piceae UAMH 11346]|uniref:Bis(5'-adenosyl)-triphosphatase n=1 Tax=Ophiostoma piceae (strain UAMH 11346) TaxID=1262450 RepID=S3BXW3_OPHP1|nr:bis(5 -adenosyl)-triphosphatase [Ophiostoma piceae UAMH 11346]